MHRSVVLFLLALLGSGCATTRGPAASPADAAPPAPAAANSGTQEPAAATHPPEALPFITDDYGQALADAKARQVPLFVEAWAPW